MLKQQWGFRGFVVSDWGAVHDTVGPAVTGMDLEMDLADPVGSFWGDGQLLQACERRRSAVSMIDDKVRRILRTMEFTGVLDEQWPIPDREMVEHRALVRQLGSAGTVLLKNDGGVLPLDKNATQMIAVIGPNAMAARIGGRGQFAGNALLHSQPARGVGERRGAEHDVRDAGRDDPAERLAADDSVVDAANTGRIAKWLAGRVLQQHELQGAPALTRVDASVDFDWSEGSPAPGIGVDGFSVRWTGTFTPAQSETYALGTLSDDGVRLWLDDTLVIDNWSNHAAEYHSVDVAFNAGQAYSLRMEYYENGGQRGGAALVLQPGAALADAVAAAASADAAIVFVGCRGAGERGVRPRDDGPRRRAGQFDTERGGGEREHRRGKHRRFAGRDGRLGSTTCRRRCRHGIWARRAATRLPT